MTNTLPLIIGIGLVIIALYESRNNQIAKTIVICTVLSLVVLTLALSNVFPDEIKVEQVTITGETHDD